MKVVYTKSGSRYLLDKQAMTFASSEKVFPLVEWPDIEIGRPLTVLIKKDAQGEPRKLTTSEVVGVV